MGPDLRLHMLENFLSLANIFHPIESTGDKIRNKACILKEIVLPYWVEFKIWSGWEICLEICLKYLPGEKAMVAVSES